MFVSLSLFLCRLSLSLILLLTIAREEKNWPLEKETNYNKEEDQLSVIVKIFYFANGHKPSFMITHCHQSELRVLFYDFVCLFLSLFQLERKEAFLLFYSPRYKELAEKTIQVFCMLFGFMRFFSFKFCWCFTNYIGQIE